MHSAIIYEILQLAGILAFAISGALIGVRRGLDLLGVLVVGAATGLGGGILRDLLLGVHPPVSFTHWPNLTVALTGSLVVFFVHPRLSRIRRFEITYDAFGLGLFSSTAAASTFAAGNGALTSVLVGVITAIGGGVVRDVLVNTIPIVLTRELYAISALLGAALSVSVYAWTGRIGLASLVGGAAAVTLRLISVWRGWNLPLPRGTQRAAAGRDAELG